MCLPDCPFCQRGIFDPAPQELIDKLGRERTAAIVAELESSEDPKERSMPGEFGENNEKMLAVMAPFCQDAGRHLFYSLPGRKK